MKQDRALMEVLRSIAHDLRAPNPDISAAVNRLETMANEMAQASTYQASTRDTPKPKNKKPKAKRSTNKPAHKQTIRHTKPTHKTTGIGKH